MKFSVLIFAFMPLTIAAETVYKSVDEQGNVFFSDQPSANAEKLEVEAAPAIDFNQLSLPPRAKEKVEDTATYQQVLILEPGNEQTIHDNPGNLTVLTVSEPILKQGHQIMLEMDGKPVSVSRENTVKIENIDRGQHTLTARVVDADGNVLLSSRPTTFFMRRVSKLTSPLNKDATINQTGGVSPVNPPRVAPDGVTPVNPPKPGGNQAAPANTPVL